MADKNLISSSADIACGTPPAGNKGTNPGSYDGISGFQGRTPSPNAVPEKLIDNTPSLPKGKE